MLKMMEVAVEMLSVIMVMLVVVANYCYGNGGDVDGSVMLRLEIALAILVYTVLLMHPMTTVKGRVMTVILSMIEYDGDGDE